MSILNIFKKKPSSVKATEGKEEKAEVGLPSASPKIKPAKKGSVRAYRVLVSPHITEKATELEKENKYVFKIFSRANKTETAKAVEDLYGVEVVNVRIINAPRKKKRLAGQAGWKKGYKKAIVRIKKGQKIEIMPR